MQHVFGVTYRLHCVTYVRADRHTQPNHRSTCRHVQSLHVVSLVDPAVLRLILHLLHNSSISGVISMCWASTIVS
jgi:hypothetical protein